MDRSARSFHADIDDGNETTIVSVPDGQTFFITDIQAASGDGLFMQLTVKAASTTLCVLMDAVSLERIVHCRSPLSGAPGEDIKVTPGGVQPYHVTISGYFE